MRRLVLILAALGLSACAAANDAADTIARERAKGVVNTVVAERFPGLNAAPITGVTQSTAQEVLTIAQRPEAVQCIAQNSITMLG